MVFSLEASPDLFLVTIGNIPHSGDLIEGPQNPLRVAVAIQAPAHFQGVGLPHERHLIHATVAAFAADSLSDVNAVVEIHKIGQIVNPRPLNRFAGAETGAYRF